MIGVISADAFPCLIIIISCIVNCGLHLLLRHAKEPFFLHIRDKLPVFLSMPAGQQLINRFHGTPVALDSPSGIQRIFNSELMHLLIFRRCTADHTEILPVILCVNRIGGTEPLKRIALHIRLNKFRRNITFLKTAFFLLLFPGPGFGLSAGFAAAKQYRR